MSEKDPRDKDGLFGYTPGYGLAPEVKSEKHLAKIASKLDMIGGQTSSAPNIDFGVVAERLTPHFEALIESEQRLVELAEKQGAIGQAALGMSVLQTSLQAKMSEEMVEAWHQRDRIIDNIARMAVETTKARDQRGEIIDNTARMAMELDNLNNNIQSGFDLIHGDIGEMRTSIKDSVDNVTFEIGEMKSHICDLLEDIGTGIQDFEAKTLASQMEILESLYDLKEIFIWSHREQMWVLNQQLFALNHPLQTEAAEAFEIGEKCRIDEEYEDAMSMFKRSTELNPREVRSHFSSGLIYFKIGEPGKAAESFRKSGLYAENPVFSAYAMMHHAKILIFDKDFQSAFKILMKALEKDPTNCDVLYEIALFYVNAGKTKEAYEYFEKTYKLDMHYATKFLLNMDFASIHDKITEKVKDTIFNSYPILQRAKIRMLEKDFQSAFKLLMEALKEDPTNCDVLYEIALYYVKTGKTQEAYEYFEKTYKLNMNYAEKFLSNMYFAIIHDKIIKKMKEIISRHELFEEIDLLLKD